ncbi:MAG: BamA/TamA family outer membrane protein [Rhodospirillaceae bacterium]
MALAIVALSAVALEGRPAWAFDFFGLFGSDEEPPAPRSDALTYRLTLTPFDRASDDESNLAEAFHEVSETWKLRRDTPPDADTLIRRVEADLSPILDTLWAYGYFNAEVTATVAGVRVVAGTVPPEAVQAAEATRGHAIVPVEIAVRPGPLFHIARITITDPGGAPLVDVPQLRTELKPGDPARAADIRALAAGLIDAYRARSHPLAKTTRVEASVDHTALTLDAALTIDSGPSAGLGEITITGTRDVPSAVVRSFVYRRVGEPYSPKVLEATRKAVARIPALGGVRIKEATQLDPAGNLPLTIEVTERPPRLVGFEALYSSIDGPSLETYWEHHNLFGGAEQLRLDAKLFSAPPLNKAGGSDLSGLDFSDLGGRVSATFLKPALWGSRNDLLVDALADHERIGETSRDGYTSTGTSLNTGLRHRWSEQLSAQAGVRVARFNSEDVLGTLSETLVGLPLSVDYDTSDDPLNPTSGVQAKGALTPYVSAFGPEVTMLTSRISASTYYALDEDGATVLAGRIGAGAIFGAGLAQIPPGERFYAGGGGSVRGYGFRTLSPTIANRLTGGRSLLEASAEARFRITRTLGLVPFVDIGDAFGASIPDFANSTPGIGAGIGLRYLTPVGPIRLDVATPLTRRSGDTVAVYISIGQAF